MLDRLRHHVKDSTVGAVGVDEHRAFVELLVLAILVDHRVSMSELDGMEQFDATHPDWDENDFSVAQYIAPAVSSMRSQLTTQAPGDLASFITPRITDAGLRRQAASACADMLARDGLTRDEEQFLALVRSALA